ncbi:MAG: prenyltransferase, partial [Bacteroidota bacterium]
HRNPFSGGSGMLTEGRTTPRAVLTAAIVMLAIGLAIGIYFIIVSHWILLALIALGAFATVFYSSLLARIMLGELFAGLTLGTFVVLGTYIAMTATPGMDWGGLLPREVWVLSISPGILTALLLLLNEFPDAEADIKGGRRHLVIVFGIRGGTIIYIAGLIATYAIIFFAPLAEISSYWTWIALATIPIASRASDTAWKHGGEVDLIIPAMGQNVIVVLATDLLIALSVFVSA